VFSTSWHDKKLLILVQGRAVYSVQGLIARIRVQKELAAAPISCKAGQSLSLCRDGKTEYEVGLPMRRETKDGNPPEVLPSQRPNSWRGRLIYFTRPGRRGRASFVMREFKVNPCSAINKFRHVSTRIDIDTLHEVRSIFLHGQRVSSQPSHPA